MCKDWCRKALANGWVSPEYMEERQRIWDEEMSGEHHKHMETMRDLHDLQEKVAERYGAEKGWQGCDVCGKGYDCCISSDCWVCACVIAAKERAKDA